ncbi:hypothetical protein [Streptomyces sp. BPTC-684]|uniref:hypothetical protein n=1 Tax=Streptomyces sp. BPTC-684 TaxID=3043734 RepID=UPI0024B0B564|nr:hypothetical protein [Streptomyces sp. BPTC-684]WHM41135.1 hypothetical protein QIY60_32610 [Streptomyces sp. BPTC-684]
MTHTTHTPARLDPLDPGTPAGRVRRLRAMAGLAHQELAYDAAEALARQREQAVHAADQLVDSAYWETLKPLLTWSDWTGYPGFEDDEGRYHRPCAIAHVGEGVWLHVETRSRGTADDLYGALSLITPCACGNGYLDLGIEDEADFLATFYEYVGSADTGPVACASECHSITRTVLARLNEH